MAFGRTDRVETAAHRPQAWRASEMPRAADPARSRFDAMLPKTESPKPVDKTADRTTDKTSDPPAASDRRETAPGAGADQGRTQGARATTPPARGRADAADAPGKGKDKTVAGDAAPSPGDEAKTDPAGQPGAAEVPAAQVAVTGAVAPTPTPVAPLVPPQTATPAPAAAAPAGTGTPQAGAIPAGAAPGGTAIAGPTGPTGPAGDGDAETGDVGEPGRAGTASKDFLAALSDSGAAAGPVADPAAAPASGSPADAGGAAPTISGQGLLSPAVGGTTGAAHAAAAANPAAPAPPAVPIGQVPMTIGLRSLAGSSEFQIRLDPAELGRIEVKLEIDRAKGTVSTHLTVDRPDTLALLQRDAGQLQQALTQAGLDPGAGGVNLSLRQESGQTAGGQGGQTGGDGRPNTPWSADRADTLSEAVPVQRLRGYGGLDIRI